MPTRPPLARDPRDLGLGCPTPAAWCETACADLPALLNDHAHLERKAASNALALLHRWPFLVPSSAADRRTWVRLLAAIAADETRHLSQVLTELEHVGGELSTRHTNAYAAALRKHVRLGDGHEELLDRLVVSGLIEARSCERFQLLAVGAPSDRLRSFYDELARSEAGHHQMFTRMAYALLDDGDVDARQETLRDIEADIVRAQPPGPQMHSWVP